MTRPGRADTCDRVLTVPNVVTLIRLACIPLFVILVLSTRHRYSAAVLLAVLGGTDWVDGQLARRLNQVSNLGKVLDPVVDRLLLITSALTIVAVGAVPVDLAVLALVREVLVAMVGIALGLAGVRRFDVAWTGKAATFAMMFALPLFLVGHSGAHWHSVAEALAWCFAVPGIGLGWYSAASYVPIAKRALLVGRSGRSGAGGPGEPQQDLIG